MTPRTKIQKAVWSEYLKREHEGKNVITEAQAEWITAKAFEGEFIKISDKHDKCCQCGKVLKNGIKICPVCGNRNSYLTMRSPKRVSNDISVLDYYKNWQIIRIIEVCRFLHKNSVETSMRIVSEEWINLDGKKVIIARNRMMSGGYNWNGRMEIRTEHFSYYSYGYNSSYSFSSTHTIPGMNIHPFFRSRGISAVSYRKIQDSRLFENISNDNLLETLLKTKMYHLANSRLLIIGIPEHCYRLAVRYRYDPTDITSWRDYINQMVEMNMDTHNPSILLPKDLKEAHRLLTEKVNRKRERERMIIERERKAKEMKTAVQNEEKYRKRMGALLGVAFSADGISFHVLQTPLEFLEEGTAMHHCVASYWSHENSLILSARDKENNRIETVEINLRTFTIVQSQGPCNRPTEWHDRIKQIVMDNMTAIRKAAA